MKLKFMLHGLHPNYTRMPPKIYPWIWTHYETTKVYYEFNWLIFLKEPAKNEREPWRNYILKQL